MIDYLSSYFDENLFLKSNPVIDVPINVADQHYYKSNHYDAVNYLNL